eukprot:m51a1_g11639 hypothetical protein (376) ;mRNA; f:1145-5060
MSALSETAINALARGATSDPLAACNKIMNKMCVCRTVVQAAHISEHKKTACAALTNVMVVFEGDWRTGVSDYPWATALELFGERNPDKDAMRILRHRMCTVEEMDAFIKTSCKKAQPKYIIIASHSDDSGNIEVEQMDDGTSRMVRLVDIARALLPLVAEGVYFTSCFTCTPDLEAQVAPMVPPGKFVVGLVGEVDWILSGAEVIRHLADVVVKRKTAAEASMGLGKVRVLGETLKDESESESALADMIADLQAQRSTLDEDIKRLQQKLDKKRNVRATEHRAEGTSKQAKAKESKEAKKHADEAAKQKRKRADAEEAAQKDRERTARAATRAASKHMLLTGEDVRRGKFETTHRICGSRKAIFREHAASDPKVA